MTSLALKLKEILEPTINGLGFELWGIETPEETSGILRIYIDSKDGITLDDTAKVSEQISAILDVEDIIERRYRLEVSSPGLERPLFTAEQYKRFSGNKIKVRLKSSIENQKNYCGILKKVTKDAILLHDEAQNREVALPINLIFKANLISNQSK